MQEQNYLKKGKKVNIMENYNRMDTGERTNSSESRR